MKRSHPVLSSTPIFDLLLMWSMNNFLNPLSDLRNLNVVFPAMKLWGHVPQRTREGGSRLLEYSNKAATYLQDESKHNILSNIATLTLFYCSNCCCPPYQKNQAVDNLYSWLFKFDVSCTGAKILFFFSCACGRPFGSNFSLLIWVLF